MGGKVSRLEKAQQEQEQGTDDVLNPDSFLSRLAQSDEAQVLHWLPPDAGKT